MSCIAVCDRESGLQQSQLSDAALAAVKPEKAQIYKYTHIFKKKKKAQFMFLILAKSGKHVASHYVSARVWHI